VFHDASRCSFPLHSLTALAESPSEIAMPKKPSQPKPQKNSLPNELPLQAYEFGRYFSGKYEGETITNDHVRAMYIWEFQKEKLDKVTPDKFRTSQSALRQVVEDFHSQNPEWPRLNCPDDMAFNPLSPALRDSVFDPLVAFHVATLAEKHFLELRKELRSLLVESIKLQNQLASRTLKRERAYFNPPVDLLLGLKSIDDFTHILNTSEGITYIPPLAETGDSLALFRVPWSLKDSELLKLFAEHFKAWLKANRPKEKNDRRGKSERRSMESELNALGADRLNRAKRHGSNKASARTSRLSRSREKTSGIKNLSRSRKKSAEAIARFDLCGDEHIREIRVKVENQVSTAKPTKK
jgi:hypothetical protein